MAAVAAAVPVGMNAAPRTPALDAPSTPRVDLDAEEVYAPDPVMSFLEAVPWDGVSLCLLDLCVSVCVHFVLQMPMRNC